MKPITRQNVERAYGMYARFYDLVFGAVLEGGRRAMCDAVGAQAPAALLEVGVGTGLTLARYPAATALTGIDLSRDMLRHAQRRAAALPGRRIALHCMDAEQLAFDAAERHKGKINAFLDRNYPDGGPKSGPARSIAGKAVAKWLAEQDAQADEATE